MSDLATLPRDNDLAASTVESVLLDSDISKLQPAQRVAYYNRVCESLGLNPLTKPFAFITKDGKTTFYALKSCTEQLREKRGVSIAILSREIIEGIYVVTARATDREGRTDESIGAVPIALKKGDDLSNAMMRAETKSKRRVTLSICGLGMLDESEVDSIAGAEVKPFNDHSLPGKPKNYAETIDPVTGEVTPIKASKGRSSKLASAHILKGQLNISDEIWKGRLMQMFKVDSSAKLSDEQLIMLVKALEGTALRHAEARAQAHATAEEALAASKPKAAPEAPAESMLTNLQHQLISSGCTTNGIDEAEVCSWYGVDALADMTTKEGDEAIDRLANMTPQSQKETK